LNEGVVKLKTDLPFWLSMNDPAFGGFGVPWGPWGFNSGMGEQDEDRDTAEQLGLIKPGEKPQPIVEDVNHMLQASTEGLDDDMLTHLRATFGDQVEFDDNAVKWKGNTNANQDNSTPRRDDDASDDLTRRIGSDVRAIFEAFRSRDNGEPLSPEDSISAGAAISAVASGRKPLYHEAWGTPASSDLIRRLWDILPSGIKAILGDGHLYVYNPEAVQAVIAANPDAYPGYSLFDKIRQSVITDTDGDLLGYGAPTRFFPGRVKVEIIDPSGIPVFGFYTARTNANHFGAERALDFTQAYGEDYSYEIFR